MSKKDYNFTDSKPVGTLSNKELINLEQKYRLLLKKSGFSDIEMWDNTPREKVKVVKFIKGHLRKCSYKRKGSTCNKVYNTFQDVQLKWDNYFSYYQIIGLFAHHSKDIPDKYREILQDLSTSGNLALSIRNTNSSQSHEALRYYLKRNLNKMIEFVNKEFGND